jgi:3-oxoacyl-[acyl-carrier-protein] synthase II
VRRVVITGIGVIAPNGVGRDAFWASLLSGVSAIRYVSAFDPSPFPSKVAGEVRDFRPLDFMRRRSAKETARSTQFALAATRLALDDAHLSITPAIAPHISVFFGNSGGGDVFEAAAKSLAEEGFTGVSPFAALEYPPHAPASYVTIEFGLTGPALSLSSNCCTGIDTISSAAAQIASGRTRVAIAGSAEAPISPVVFSTFCALGSLSTRECPPEQASRPYDRLRDGLVASEGGAILILEELGFASTRGARIYAEILGAASASEALGMRKGDLSGEVLANVISRALDASHLGAADIDHINAHGSSLPDFDICDSKAFKLALGNHAFAVPTSSIKSMIGQPFSAAGSLQTAAACLAIQNQQVPPTINQTHPDPECDLDYVPNVSRIARIRNVLVNGHSFGGSVAALILGSYAP